MRRTGERTLTTHTGSLPRPPELTEALVRRDRGELPLGEAQSLPAPIEDAVTAIAHRQAAVGIDLLNDGELGKIGCATYVRGRPTCFDDTATCGVTTVDPKVAWMKLAALVEGAAITSKRLWSRP